MKSLLIELKILCVRKQFRVLKSFVLSFCLVLVISLAGLSFVSLADVNDLMIGTGSNALMTMELDDSDYSVMPMSSIVSVTNTVNRSYLEGWICLVNNESGGTAYRSTPIDANGRLLYKVPSGYTLIGYGVNLNKGALPGSGIYRLQVDFGSQFSVEYRNHVLQTTRLNTNASATQANTNIDRYVTVSSGDWYFDAVVDLGSINNMIFICWTQDIVENEYVDGTVNINFTLSSASPQITTVGNGMASADYESGVSSSLSDLSSSVDTMTDEISGVTEAIQNLQGAMEPHYSNVLTQLHHITEQLHAFYDQVYNNIHLPELNMLTQIKEAIENIDLQIEVDISEVKTAINNMSTAVQNKLQSTTDQITGGYDNSGIVSDQTELDSALNEYQQAEDELFEDAKEHINNFEFDTPLEAYVKPLEDISYFLTGIYNGLGGLNIPIQFSLTLTIALILIGYYRIKR